MGVHSNGSLRIAGVLLAAALAARPGLASAQQPASDDVARAIDPAAPCALCRVLTAGPGLIGPTLLASGGYGYTESVLGQGDAHHRVAGALTLDERPLPWLDFALRLDGRYDAHAIPGRPTDTGLVGDPRFYARVDQSWPSGLRLAARAGLWLPGRDAPSLDASALSPEILGAISYVPRDLGFSLTANAGYRLDRSAHSAPDAAALSPGDRLALQVSAFNEVLVGVAATVGRGRTQGFLEASADLLVGAGAPGPGSSPIFLGGGGRFAVSRSLRLEAAVEASPSSRPDTGAMAPLVPIPPRFAVWLGLSFRFDGPPPPRPTPAATPVPPPPIAVEPAAKVETPETAGPVAGGEGGTVSGPPAPAAEVAAERRAPQGQIRGLIRSLRGLPVIAEVAIVAETSAATAGSAGEPPPAVHPRTEGGRFQVDVSPGRYRVTISAAGYQSQQRRVEVEENGVTLLNVDLRSER